MKKLVTLLAAAGMVAAAAAPASAVDVKIDYRHRVSFTSTSENFDGSNLEQIKNRVRLGLTMAASENLKGYVQFQLLQNELMGQQENTHGSNDTEVRQMYMDWKVPGTAVSVRMGRMEMGLPADAFGENAVMAAGFGSRDGVVVTAPVADWLTLTALWNRAAYESPATAKVKNDLDQNLSDDVYAAVASLKFDGVKADVYAAYATLDGATASDTPKAKWSGSSLPKFEGDAYWIGFTSTWSFFDPFTLKLSAAYGAATADKYDVRDTKGWNIQAKASYKTAFGTPVFGAWYFSGDDAKDDLGTMPSVQGAFTPIRMYHDASTGLNGGTGYENPVGTWGIQAGIEKMSFVKDLSHGFWVSYVEGTNDQDLVSGKKSDYLGEEDSFVAFNLSNTYKIYKNLSASLELYYMISDFETEVRDLSEDDYGFELTFEYKF